MMKNKRKKYRKFRKDNKCRFCRENITNINYRNLTVLQKLVTPQGKMFSARRSGNCAKHQRVVKKAIKYARFIGLLPYVG